MCGNFFLIQSPDSLKFRFKVNIPGGINILPSYKISPGQKTPVITGERPHEIQLYRFGLTPSWAQKQMTLINARSEGDNNPTDDPDFSGEMAIFNKPAFRKPIRSQRCLIPADGYLEGTTVEKLNKPFVVYLRNKVRPFAFAGIWDAWKNPATEELIHSFAILTIFPNQLASSLPHHRMPVILNREDEFRWLRDGIPNEEIASLMRPYPAGLMNAFPISPEIKNPRVNDVSILQPIGPPIFPE